MSFWDTPATILKLLGCLYPTMQSEDGGEDVIDDVEELVKQDPLIQLFGDSPRTRMLIALVDALPRAVNPSTISDRACVSRSAWYRHKDELVETGLVYQERSVGNSPMYTVDESDERVELLQKIRDYTSEELR